MFGWLFRRNVLPLYISEDVDIIVQRPGWIYEFTDTIMNLLEQGKWNN